MVEDITAHKRIEALKLSEGNTATSLNANDAIFIVDANTSTAREPQGRGALGYTREELIGMSIFDIIPRTGVSFHGNAAEATPRARSSSASKTRDGRLIDVEVSSSAIEAYGEVIGSRDIVRDNTGAHGWMMAQGRRSPAPEPDGDLAA
jgi:PAS domain S-box-containing protein